MNPPFAQQIAFFNHAARFASTIVWIAGLNVRLWTTEDSLSPTMHLSDEWIVPHELTSFESGGKNVHIRTVVQVWKRHTTPRPLWSLACSLSPCKDQKHPPNGGVVVKRVGSPGRIGLSGILGKDCRVVSRNPVTTTMGTLRNDWGTAIAFEKGFPVETLRRRRAVIRDLLMERSYSPSLLVLSVPVLSALLSRDWRRLHRPLRALP
jgi:hypothetical protein